MNIFSKNIKIPKSDLERIQYILTHEPKDETECWNEDATYSLTVHFENGYEMDVKVCGVQYREGESNLPWTEAVLFYKGSECICSEPCEEFEGEWSLEYNNTKYIVVIESEE